jgi:hypothetical protein
MQKILISAPPIVRALCSAGKKNSNATPSASWSEAAVKARYLIGLFAATLEARNQRRQELIAQVLGRAAEGGSDGATFSQIA